MNKPIIGIIMGSDSDLPVMKDAAEILDEFSIPYDITVLSAHRTPHQVIEYVMQAEKKNMKIFIAGAGGAAHLAGVIAALTTHPVIGVPILSKTLNGIDSLYSIVQMPPGVPVATVAINGAKNAGLLAIQMLALSDRKLKTKLLNFKKKLNDSVMKKAKKLQVIGYEKYLEEMKK